MDAQMVTEQCAKACHKSQGTTMRNFFGSTENVAGK